MLVTEFLKLGQKFQVFWFLSARSWMTWKRGVVNKGREKMKLLRKAKITVIYYRNILRWWHKILVPLSPIAHSAFSVLLFFRQILYTFYNSVLKTKTATTLILLRIFCQQSFFFVNNRFFFVNSLFHNWWLNFNDISTRLWIFHFQRFMNCVHSMFINTFLCCLRFFADGYMICIPILLK